MSWVRQEVDVNRPHRHHCAPPVDSFGAPNGVEGDLWRCRICGRLLRIALSATWYGGRHDWHRATWWQRWRYRDAGWGEDRPC